LLLGFTATSAQILLLREFISTFHGNELVIGVFLSIWLLATAVGSGPVARLLLRPTIPEWSGPGSGRRLSVSPTDGLRPGTALPFAPEIDPAGSTHKEDIWRRAARGFGTAQVIASFSLVIGVVGFLAPAGWLRPGPGEVTGLLPALACAALYLSPLCVTQGLLFPLGARMLGPLRPSAEVSSAYVLEAIGAGVGGVLFSLLLVRILSPFQSIALLACANFLVAAILLSKAGRARIKYVSFLLVVLSASASVFDPVTEWADSRRWGNLPVLAARRTPYGNLTALSLGSDFSFFQDGLLIFSTEDVQSAEEVGHLPLLQHSHPEDVALIGGGLGGALGEVLKEPSLRTVDYVELDPGLISLAKDVLPSHFTSVLRDPRVRLHFTDGRRFLQTTTRQYDVIIINVPPPYTAQLNRFFTREIFALARGRLREGGIFSFSAPGVQEYISDDLAAFLGSLYRTSKSVFVQTILLPVGKSLFVCSPGENRYVSSSPDSLLLRLGERRIKTLFLRDYFLTSMLSPERVEYAEQRIAVQRGTDLNSDLKPISFYYDLVMWSAEHEQPMRPVLLWVRTHTWSLLIAAFGLGLSLLGLGRRRRSKAVLPLTALAISGFAAMVLELQIVLSFQLFYGSLYDRIGLLLTSYMVGLGLGASLEKRSGPESAGAASRPGLIQMLTGCLALVFLCVALAMSRIQEAGILRTLEWLFPVFALAAGGLGGALFSSASRTYFQVAAGQGEGGEKRAGVTYAWDLAGSWAGAALCSVVLFPVAGIVWTALTVAFLLFASGGGLLLARDQGEG